MSDPSWRWGVAGPGGIAGQFAQGTRIVEGDAITAVASRPADRSNAFGDRFEMGTRYGDYRALADDRDVDIVYVATPHSTVPPPRGPPGQPAAATPTESPS